MFNLPTICLTITRNGQEERTMVLENSTLEHLDVTNVVCVEMAKRVIL